MRFAWSRIGFLVAVGLVATTSLRAHHSFSAEFDGNKPIELKGMVTKIDWANPHVYFYVDVKDPNGTVVNWGCETNGPNGLIRQGWKRDSLKVGDEIVVKCYPAKDGSKLVFAREVALSDGRKIFAGAASDYAAGK
jgi:hypothetical protein